jgi:predicted nucleic acid-binding protein
MEKRGKNVMIFVLDASVTLTWLFPVQITPYSRAVLESIKTDSAFVPVIWSLEITNVALGAERNKRLSRADITLFFEMLEASNITPRELSLDKSALFSFALLYELSAYDACYLALASQLRLPLATLDKKIRNAANRAGVELFQPKSLS